MTDDTRTLLGLVDPSGVSLGFLVPLFTGGSANAPLVQRIGPHGAIEGFEPYEAPDAPLLEAPPWRAAVAGPAVYAFAFGKGDVVMVEGEDGRDALRARIADPVLEKRPMLAMEVADFQSMPDLKRELAARAHALMRKASADTADRWLDLSVLTPELRRVLARGDGRTSARLAPLVVARRRREAIEILGVGEELSPSQFSELRAAAFDATQALLPLYPPPTGGWRVQIRKLERKPRHDAAATVLLASRRARQLALASPWSAVPDIDIHVEDGIAFTRVVEETETPLFVVYDAAEPEVMRRAMGDWTVREMHGIALEAARPRIERDAPPQPWPATHVPTAGIGGGARSDVASIRLAFAVELDRSAGSIQRAGRNSALLRARGTGPDPDADAGAALYDRAWGLGLAPWRSLLIPGHGRRARPAASYSADYSASYAPESEPGWAANALFGDASFLGDTLTERVMNDLRSTAALLIDREQRQEPDLDLHRASVTRLLERQRWSIEDDDFRRPDARLVARGRKAAFQLMVRPNGILQPDWQRQSLFEIDLMSIDRLLVSGPAAPGAVLSHLAGSGELVVGVRDLTTLDAAHATPLSVVAAQLRRQVTGLPSSARTHFVALVAMQALRGGRVDEGGRGLLDLIEHPGLGRDVHLAIGSAKLKEDALSARVRIFDGVKGPASRWSETGEFVLTVSPDAVSITSMAWTGDGKGSRR